MNSPTLFTRKVIVMALGAIAATALSATPAACQTAFSNFGPGQSYDQTTAWGLAWGQHDFSQLLAMSFTPTVSGNLQGVDAAIYGSNFGGSSDVALSINLNNGDVPGAALDTLHGTPPDYPQILSETSTLHPELIAGTEYWLVATVQPGYFGGWGFNDTGDVGAMDAMFANTPPYTQGGPWVESTDTLGAFDVLLTPEGSSLELLAAGALPLLAIFLRPRRAAERPSQE